MSILFMESQEILLRLNFLEISYGSLKESKYLLYFSLREKYIIEDEYRTGMKLAEEISRRNRSYALDGNK